jgi:anti-sigma B factor antagonist
MRVSHDRGCVVVWLRGELDVAEARAAREFFAAVAAQGCSRLVVDVTDLEFIDAAGVSALAAVARAALGAGGWLHLVDASPMLRRILRIVHLTGVLPVYETVHAAITAGVAAP